MRVSPSPVAAQRQTPPPYDPESWDALPLPDKARLVCQAWALQGYGTPLAVYGLYVLKIGLYVGGWLAFCARSPAIGDVTDPASWLHPVAFHKALLFSALFEVLGLGCGSGPLSGAAPRLADGRQEHRVDHRFARATHTTAGPV